MSNINPELITADDRTRASGGKVGSTEFRRMLRLTWPHRRFIGLGLAASIAYGFLHSVTIVAMLPVLKVMMSDEGLHGWVDRSVAQQRLGVMLDWAESSANDADEASSANVIITDIPGDSPLRDNGTSPFDSIHDYRIANPAQTDDSSRKGDSAADIRGSERDQIRPMSFFRDVASAEDLAEIVLTTKFAGTNGKLSGPVTLTLQTPTFVWKLLRSTAGIVPRERQRGDRVTALYWVIGAVVIVALLSNVARFISRYYMAIGVLRSVMDLRRTLYRKVLRLPMDFFSTNTSDTVSRFVQDAQEIQRGLMAFFGKMLTEPIRAVFLLLWALWLDARMTLTMLVVAPIAVLVFWSVGRKIRKANMKLLKAYGIMIGALGTTLEAIGVVKAYGAENVERKRLWQIDRRMFKQQLRIAKLEAFLRPLLEVLGVAVIAVVTAWLGSQVIRQQIKLEEFATLILVLGMLIDPLRRMSDVYPRLMRSAAGAGRIYAVVDAPEEAELLEGAVEMDSLVNGIEFRNVTFAYRDAPAPALHNVNLRIAKGETVAIVGPNGSGKTTLTRLILRFYDPMSGEVLFDGVDVRKARLRSLRRLISVVSQDPVVFAMSVADNIAYGARGHDHDQVVNAARRAHADEFIRARTGGYEEVIGDRGSTLSGGQRQRVCIARAMMRDAPILIFDEATSQIDSESEKQIQDAVREYAAGRTTILIAHRLSTIRFASRVIVMDEGQAIDNGTHEELVARCPIYAMLCQTQLVDLEATPSVR